MALIAAWHYSHECYACMAAYINLRNSIIFENLDTWMVFVIKAHDY